MSCPVKIKDGNIYTVENLKDDDFTWSKPLEQKTNLFLLDKIYTKHRFSASSIFRPHTNEVLEQIPDSYFNKFRTLYFTTEPYSLHINLLGHGGKHLGVTYLLRECKTISEYEKSKQFNQEIKELVSNQYKQVFLVEQQKFDHYNLKCTKECLMCQAKLIYQSIS